MTGLRQELNKTSRCYTERHCCFKGIAFFPESSWKVGHMFALVTILSFQALHYCPLACYHHFWNGFCYCSFADLLQSQCCLYYFLSSISWFRCLCSQELFCCLCLKSSSKCAGKVTFLLNLDSQEDTRLDSKIKLYHGIMSLRCQHWEVMSFEIVSWSSLSQEKVLS